MKRITLILMLLLTASTTFSIIFHSCEKESVEFSENDTQLLSIKGSLNNPLLLTTSDFNAIQEAMKRMDVHVANGKIITNGYTAQQLNISEDLFFDIKQMFSKSNGDIRQLTRKRTKTKGEATHQDTVNCVPTLISLLLGEYGIDESVGDIINWCASKGYYQKDKGVYSEFLGDIIDHYLNAQTIGLDTIPDNFLIDTENISGSNCFMAVIQTDNNYGHVVQVLQTIGHGENTLYNCYNPQDRGMISVTKSAIVSVYRVNGGV